MGCLGRELFISRFLKDLFEFFPYDSTLAKTSASRHGVTQGAARRSRGRAFGAMPSAKSASRRGDKTQVRLDGFLSPNSGGVSRGSFRLLQNKLKQKLGSAFAPCPVCGLHVSLRLMNDHLDSARCAPSVSIGDKQATELTREESTEPTKVLTHTERAISKQMSPEKRETKTKTTSPPSALRALMEDAKKACTASDATQKHGALPGLFVVEDFITVEEETELMAFLDEPRRCAREWRSSTFNGEHAGMKWGVVCDLKRRVVTNCPTNPMPIELRTLGEKIRATHSAVTDFHPNEANAICYRRRVGHHLNPHCDDRQLSSGILVNLSLLGDCLMSYTKDVSGTINISKPKTVDVFLPRRSLQIQTGTVRYEYRHAIANENLRHDRRVSITFRESKTPTTKTRARGSN